ncbi:Phosphotransferase enzyme family protein [Pedococcus dokdonensis]|uniref:Phosphotransferase enzyme family protein n=1 Tax=Pedococcus dokdonensis TaxID=443156 RepID=A0A1H0LSD2_9MICO|nr:phosphotransferase [Pedococcus dokdonensis]SDO71003.1 Phosphotransferase enzyme family protein [Pedococcus dokdonensis]
MDEHVLSGGNTGVVVRVGDTVRRPAGHWTPAVHALLHHLESVGFDAAPRALGIDARGREVASYLPGVAGTLGPDVLDPRFRTVEACRAIGAWLRGFHDAQVGFAPDPSLPWRVVPGRALALGEVVVHHDVGTYNTVLRPDGSFGVIDFDFASPGMPVDDLAYVLWSWVPLWHDDDAVRRELGGVPTAERLHKFAAVLDGYAADAPLRAQVTDAVSRRMAEHSRTIEVLAAQGDPAFVRMLADGHAERPRLDAEWFAARRDLFGAAIR